MTSHANPMLLLGEVFMGSLLGEDGSIDKGIVAVSSHLVQYIRSPKPSSLAELVQRYDDACAAWDWMADAEPRVFRSGGLREYLHREIPDLDVAISLVRERE